MQNHSLYWCDQRYGAIRALRSFLVTVCEDSDLDWPMRVQNMLIGLHSGWSGSAVTMGCGCSQLWLASTKQPNCFPPAQYLTPLCPKGPPFCRHSSVNAVMAVISDRKLRSTPPPDPPKEVLCSSESFAKDYLRIKSGPTQRYTEGSQGGDIILMTTPPTWPTASLSSNMAPLFLFVMEAAMRSSRFFMAERKPISRDLCSSSPETVREKENSALWKSAVCPGSFSVG